ncbi:hypothetical protein LPLAFNJD_LOCUS2345 [Methylorubrum aminovorans]
MADDASELDPAAPGEGIEASVEASSRANFGADGRGDVPEDAVEGLELGRPAAVPIAIEKARAFLNACRTSVPRVTYGLGAKARPGQVPGRDFTQIDCSGFVREAIRRSTDLGNRFPDGSVVQHDWVRDRGFEKVDRSAGTARDGAVCIAFLEPRDSPKKIGHVVLLYDGSTLESHGGVGPNSRPWNLQGWQAKAHVYVLSPAG